MVAPTSPEELVVRNTQFLPHYKPAEIFTPGPHLADVQRMIIVTCMDQRVHPEEFLGLSTGEIPVIRNAGGRARNAIFDIAVLDSIIQITDIIVIHHTNCGLALISDEHVCKTLEPRSAEQLAKYDVEDFCFTDVPKSVKDDIVYLREHPFVRKETRVSGFVYETENGNLLPVEGF